MWLGVTEYLFRTPGMLDEAIDTAIEDHTFRDDDLEFTFAARVSPSKSSLCLCLCSLATTFLVRYSHTVISADMQQGWSECVSLGSFETYRERFGRTKEYFAPRFPEAIKLGNEMMRLISKRTSAPATPSYG